MDQEGQSHMTMNHHYRSDSALQIKRLSNLATSQTRHTQTVP